MKTQLFTYVAVSSNYVFSRKFLSASGTISSKKIATSKAHLLLLPSDAIRSRYYAVARCPSVCPSVLLSVGPSVTRRYSIEAAERIIKPFEFSGRLT